MAEAWRRNVADVFSVADVRPAWGQGVRGASVWCIFLVAGILAGETELGFQASFMGWIACYTDDYVGVGRRLGGAAVLTLLGAVVTWIATIAGNTTLWAVVASVCIGVGVGLFGVLGPPGVKKSLVLMFLTLFAVGFPADVAQANALAVATLIGGLGGVSMTEVKPLSGFVVGRGFRFGAWRGGRGSGVWPGR